MKTFIPQTLITFICIINFSLAQADQKFPLVSPGKLCFPQSSLVAEWSPHEGYRWEGVMLTHYLLIPPEDHFKKGAVFIGFRLKSQPEKLWLFNSGEWQIMDDANPQFFHTKFYDYASEEETFILEPIIRTYISRGPINVSSYINDGELLVGYGKMSESGTIRDAFYEMYQNNRFKVLWEVGSPILNTLLEVVCLNLTKEITVIIPMSGTN